MQIEPIIGMEIHVELATRSKMFSRSANVAHPDHEDAPPNTLTDPTVLALPGALPVMNREAFEMSMMVGLALGCGINRFSRWDRKSYFYPDLPKAYQISQYDLALCVDGSFEFPVTDELGRPVSDDCRRTVRIRRAHLEEDAGKLSHDLPGGGTIDGSLVDLNRAGTPLLEIVTEPDLTSAEEAVSFGKSLRQLCRFLGVTQGVMQRGHMRFEPNINCRITFDDGRVVTTPVVEVKNLNSFRALRGAIEYELREQPKRFERDGVEMGPGMKSTHGWDDAKGRTVLQRGKEDAQDYRYFPDPDLPPVEVDDDWVDRARARVGETPMSKISRFESLGLSLKDASAIVEERAVCTFFEETMGAIEHEDRARLASNLVLQSGAKLANERQVLVSDLGITSAEAAVIGALRAHDEISASGADQLFALMCDRESDVRALAESEGLLIVRDEGALDTWCDEVIASNGPIVEQIRDGKQQAIGRLIGEVMKKSGGQADPKSVRARLLEKIGS